MESSISWWSVREPPVAAEFVIARPLAYIRPSMPLPAEGRRADAIGISTIYVELLFDVELSETRRFFGLTSPLPVRLRAIKPP